MPVAADREVIPNELAWEIETATGARFRLDPEDEDPERRPVTPRFSTRRGEGFAEGGITLRREVLKDYPDVNLLDVVRGIGQDGRIAYEGQVAAIPRSLQDEQTLTLELVGLMARAKERPLCAVLCDRRTSMWGEAPLQRRVQLATESRPYGTDFTVENTNGLHFTGVADKAVQAGSVVEAWYLMPEGQLAGASQYAVTQVGTANISASAMFAGDNLDGSVMDSYTETGDGDNHAITLTTGRRFLMRRANRASTGTPGAPFVRNYKGVGVYGNHGLTRQTREPQPGEIAGLLLSDCIRWLVQTYTDFDTTWVQDAPYVLAHAAWNPEPTTVHDALLQLNDLMAWELGLWERQELHYRQADLTRTDWIVRTDDYGVALDLQGDSADNLANGIVVSYEDLAEGPRMLTPDLFSELADTDPNNPANKWDRPIWTSVEVPYPLMESDALQLGSVALAEFNRPKRPGTVQVGPQIRNGAGHLRPVWEVRAGESLAITNHPYDAPRLITDTSWSPEGLRIELELPGSQMEQVFNRVQLIRQARGLV